MKKNSLIFAGVLFFSIGHHVLKAEVPLSAASSESANTLASVVESSMAEKTAIEVSSPAVNAGLLTIPSSTETEIRSLWAADKNSQAERKLNRWMAEEKKSPAPYILSAEFNFNKKRYSKCLSSASHAIEKFPKAADAYYWRGKAYEALKKPLEAANEYQAAIMAKTAKPDAKESLNRVLAGLGNSTVNQ